MTHDKLRASCERWLKVSGRFSVEADSAKEVAKGCLSLLDEVERYKETVGEVEKWHERYERIQELETQLKVMQDAMDNAFAKCRAIHKIEKERALETMALKHQLKATRDDYHELIYAVGNKYPNESRHQTALRYIQEKETPTGIGTDQAKKVYEDKD